MEWRSFACFIEQTIGVVFRYIQGDVISRTAIFCFFLVGHLAFSVIVLKRVIKSIIMYLEIKIVLRFYIVLIHSDVGSKLKWIGGGGGLDFSEVLTSKNKKGYGHGWLCLTLQKKKPFSHVPTPLMYGFFKNLLLY